MKAYAGRLLYINLTTGGIQKVPYPEKWARRYLGGTGLCARLLWDSVKPETKPLSEENLLIFATGPLNGVGFPPSGRYVVAAKSPLTGIWAESHAGGFFGPELKYAGYDAVIITGRAEKPSWIYIHDDSVAILDASSLWGLDTVQTSECILAEMGRAGRVACIGPAGETLVKYACIIGDRYRAAGRAGMGSVMGWKNLKAIGVRGTGALEVADFDGLRELAKDAQQRYTTGRWGRACQASLGEFGTTGLIEAEQKIGRLPTKNHWSGVYADAKMIGSEAIRKGYRKKRRSCMGCNIQCKYVSMVNEGKFAGSVSEGPEYETVMAFGSNCLNHDLSSIIHANMLCNLYGMDTISTGKCISFAMECRENGLIDENIRWGDSSKIVQLIHQIAKREGIGDILAEGVREAARQVGGNAADYAIHVKGMELSGQDGRPHKSAGLTHAISVRGADHLRSLSSLDELGYVDVVKERYPDCAQEVLSLRTEKGKGRLVCDMEDLYAVVDSLLICKYGTMWPPIYYFDDFTKIIPALTGFSEFAEVSCVGELARRICLLRRAFNAREGITRKDDQLPKRDLKEPMPEGPAKGQVVHLDTMLDEFYGFRGCHSNGVPKSEELRKAGLKDVAAELEKLGIGPDD